MDNNNLLEQYIADLYHCSEIWGTRMTVEDMRITLEEIEKEKWPGDYSPVPETAEQCTRYWNELCNLYPN